MPDLPLADTIAVVAGASRGAGKGIALALGEAGATVYGVGRTRPDAPRPDGIPGTAEATAEEVTRRGVGIAVIADCTEESAVATRFEQSFADAQGQGFSFSGALTAVMVHTEGGWKFLRGHTSTAR